MKEWIKNANMIFTLAKSDFRRRFVGSFFGIVWMFVQPIVTVLIYYMIFSPSGLRGGMAVTTEVPFVLWLVSGIVPWFFFSEALINGTNSLYEYSYLVKKVVFKIEILPIVKIISAGFLHLIFILILIFLFLIMGYMPTVYWLQIIYYSFCTFVLVLGVSYLTSAVSVFFKDMLQIVNIFMQLGVWLCPIMWKMEDTVAASSGSLLSTIKIFVLKLNPMYYIVEGYHDSMARGVWFWQVPMRSLSFWLVTIALFIFGTLIFRRLKPHFADVL